MADETCIDRAEAFHRVGDVLSCKWSFAVLESIIRGSSRPSQIEREWPGLTGKVLNDRLRKLVDYGLLERRAFPEVPPRVEYSLTDRGEQMAEMVRLLGAFVDDWSSGAPAETPQGGA